MAAPFFLDRDFYVPHFELKVSGRPPGKDVIFDVVQVTYRDSFNEIDSFEITINNWDAATRRYKYTTQTLFDPGAELELSMGYYGKDGLRLMLKGEITSWRPNYPASGQPTLVIGGLNVLHRLRRQQESRVYENMTDSQIAEDIGQRLKVTINTDRWARANEKPYLHQAQHNAYGIIYLLQLARRIGYDLFVDQVDNNTLYFGPPDDRRAVPFELKYGATLVDFQPTLNLTNQVNEVQVDGWDQARKEPITATATRAPILVQGQPRFQRAYAERREKITDRSVESVAEGRQLAEDSMKRITQQTITGNGSTVGLPDLRSGRYVQITGLDTLFDGRYFITATTHTINDSGYITQFDCRREDV